MLWSKNARCYRKQVLLIYFVHWVNISVKSHQMTYMLSPAELGDQVYPGGARGLGRRLCGRLQHQ